MPRHTKVQRQTPFQCLPLFYHFSTLVPENMGEGLGYLLKFLENAEDKEC